MIHQEQISRSRRAVNPPGFRGRTGARARSPASGIVAPLLAAAGLAFFVAACGGDTTTIVEPRFGQIGEIRADVEVPLADGTGRLDGTLVWLSDGRWVLVERIWYADTEGAEVLRRSRRNPGELAGEYASLVRLLNESPGLMLPGEISTGGPSSCPTPQSRVTFTIVDEYRNELMFWTRCATGNLFTVTPGTTTPDPGATRVVTAVQLMRSFTVGDSDRSLFDGSMPFASIDHGVDSPARPTSSEVFLSQDGSAPEEWVSFWNAHAGPTAPLPSVDWTREMVLLATTGRRQEAGHRIQLRRILPVGLATQIEAIEEIPGDFCTPAALDRYPFHIVKAPLGPVPVSFAEIFPERIPCGG